ncbi:NAD(P)-dependent dehydrogenase (short-subunit alcohol dehydrogenase family) [Erwinia toletana]|uniref:NAD(P)-dependent dehydrogenase (Short-subunit alcohol dehydrogenase family) n=1 Tax=Winslowiella toletana TaxID=92490 RepID=A0ABS4PFC5_9GAMM|nr:glucose 1-dehydrogenase [Winslowiella toletana]MBP2170800.1 NAD(P)-dependent dehydrogenase (short-subunit alcohol dehydrogenase family) [Winslowiella toletana]
MGRVSGKIALVTGAGGGQGEAEARLLASEGAHVIATDINFEAVKKVVEEINAERPGAALALQHDVALSTDWERVVAEGKTAFGPITILVNNAGILAPAPYDLVTYEHWRRTMDVNAWSQFAGMQAVIPQMKEAGVGAIVNIASLAVVNACGRFTAYTASKGAVDAVSRAAAIELAPMNIRVNSVNPGVISTAMVEEAFPDQASMEAAAAAQPLRRMGRPIDVAYLVLYLASDESWFTTGTSQVIDGGLSVSGGVTPVMEH